MREAETAYIEDVVKFEVLDGVDGCNPPSRQRVYQVMTRALRQNRVLAHHGAQRDARHREARVQVRATWKRTHVMDRHMALKPGPAEMRQHAAPTSPTRRARSCTRLRILAMK